MNFPLLRLWDVEATVFGLPLLPIALFAIWGGLIAGLAGMTAVRSPRHRSDEGLQDRPHDRPHERPPGQPPPMTDGR